MLNDGLSKLVVPMESSWVEAWASGREAAMAFTLAGVKVPGSDLLSSVCNSEMAEVCDLAAPILECNSVVDKALDSDHPTQACNLEAVKVQDSEPRITGCNSEEVRRFKSDP